MKERNKKKVCLISKKKNLTTLIPQKAFARRSYGCREGMGRIGKARGKLWKAGPRSIKDPTDKIKDKTLVVMATLKKNVLGGNEYGR